MKLSDRHLGMLTILVLVGAGLLVALLMYQKNLKATTRVLVTFDELGSLQPEDPVTSRGYPVGKVGSIKFIHNKAHLELLLDDPMILRQSTVIRNENYSLMGQRRVEIIQGKDGFIVDSGYWFQGEFEPGIAEAMHLMARVREQVIAVRDLVFLLRDGNENTQSVPALTESLLSQSEQVIHQLSSTIDKATPRIHSGLVEVNKLTAESVRLVQQTDTILKEGTQQSEDGIRKANQLLVDVQKALAEIYAFLDNLESQPIAADLLYKQEMIAKVNTLVVTLQDVLKLFDEKGGLVIKDEQGKPRGLMGLRNVNLLGKTAREKKE